MSKENIENITKSNSSFAPTFVDYHVLPDINFNGHCLMNNIHIPKKSYICDIIYIYLSLLKITKKTLDPTRNLDCLTLQKANWENLANPSCRK